MALEAIPGSDNSTFSSIHDNISATEQHPKAPKFSTFFPHKNITDPTQSQNIEGDLCPFDLHAHFGTSPMMFGSSSTSGAVGRKPNSVALGKKKRRRPRVCKNKEEAETQRMTHIAVERNRRKQMNEHLAVLRSLMPESYIQRSDQASTVGGAIDFVKELEQHLQSLEAQKRVLSQQKLEREGKHENVVLSGSTSSNVADLGSPPFAQFFAYPQYSWCQVPKEHPAEGGRAVADIEATMIESHANLRVLSRKRSRQLMKIVAGFQSLRLTILHLNVTTLDSFVLYSFSLKVEEGCLLTSADDIAGAVHHMLTIIEDEADLLLLSQFG